MKILHVILFCLAFFTSHLGANEGKEPQASATDVFFNAATSADKEFNFASEFFNMLISLALLITLIVVSMWALKKILRSRSKHLNTSRGIKILERRTLNQKSSIFLVEVLGKGLILGDSPAGVHLISEFPPGTEIETLLEQETDPAPLKNPFSSLFKRKRREAADDGSPSSL